MAEIDRKTFIKIKLNNFIIFIEQTFGKNNILLREFADYLDLEKRGVEPFLKGLLEICNYLLLPMDNDEKKNTNLARLGMFLENKKLICAEEDKIKMLRYFDMFYKIF